MQQPLFIRILFYKFQEAQTLISQRKINARAIFEQNTCAGQMSSIQTSRQPKILQEFEESQARLESLTISQSSSPVTEQPPERSQDAAKTSEAVSPPEEFNYTRNLLKEGLPPRQDSEMELNVEDEEEQNWDGKKYLQIVFFFFFYKVWYGNC